MLDDGVERDRGMGRCLSAAVPQHSLGDVGAGLCSGHDLLGECGKARPAPAQLVAEDPDRRVLCAHGSISALEGRERGPLLAAGILTDSLPPRA